MAHHQHGPGFESRSGRQTYAALYLGGSFLRGPLGQMSLQRAGPSLLKQQSSLDPWEPEARLGQLWS